MKSERWQSSKSMLLSFQYFKVELKTERQWAKAGYLPVSEDCGKKLRPSRFSTGSVNTLPRYLLPEEVRAASSDELAEYFKPERERKAAQAAKRRAKLRREREQEKEQARLLLALDEQREKVLTITQSVELPAETSGGIVIDTETTGFCINDDTELLAGILLNGSKSSCDKSAQLDGAVKPSESVTNGITEPSSTSDGSAPVMTKAHNLFYPNVTTCSNEKEEQDLTKPPNCSIYKTKEIKPKLINPINQSEDIDKRSDYSRIIRDNTECDFLIQQNPEKKETILELIDIIVDTVCSAKPTIRVNGEDVPHDIVKSTFLKLNSSHIEYVLEAMDNNISDVRNIRSYLITALYNSRLTLNSYWKSRVNHDMNKR